MPLTNFPQGVSSFGMPVIGGGGHMTTGNVFFVDSGAANGADVTANGGDPGVPFATLDYAIGQATASNGDTVFVMPGHAETLAADSAVNMDVAGVTVIGLGKGDARPVFTFATLATADFKIAADDCSIHNLIFRSNIGTLAMMIEVSGDDAEISHCLFQEGTASMLTAITVGVADADSDRCWIHDNTFLMDEPGATNTGNAAIEITFDNDNIRIEDNWIFGDFDEAGIDVVAGGNASDHLVIRGNYVENTATGQYAIEVDTGGTMRFGAIVDNTLVSDATATLLEPHTLQCSGNRGSIGVTNTGDFAVPASGVLDWRMTTKNISALGTSHTTGNSPVTEFTVTGTVIIAGIAGVVSTGLTSTLNNGTLEMGVTGDTAVLCVQDAADGTAFAANDVWSAAANSTGGVIGNSGSLVVVNGGGTNIITTVATNSMTAGVMDLYCLWAPLSVDGNVVATGS